MYAKINFKSFFLSHTIKVHPVYVGCTSEFQIDYNLLEDNYKYKVLVSVSCFIRGRWTRC